MAKQECVTLFPEVEAVTKRLTDEQFGVLIRAVIAYQLRGEVYDGDDVAVDIAFQFLSSQVDRTVAFKAKKAKAARSRWDKQKEEEAEQSDTDGMQARAEECKTMQSDTEPMQSDAPNPNPIPNPIPSPNPSNNREDVPDMNVGHNPPKQTRRFTPPTLEQVQAYCRQRGKSVDAQRFVD